MLVMVVPAQGHCTLPKVLCAGLQRVRPVSITHPEHHVNIARRAAESERKAGGSALFADQFENLANYK
jgi:cysteine synthase